MRIALFHNLPSGGAKRHTFEQVKELARRGHEIVEFAPTTADTSFCSLAPYVKQQRVFDLKPVRLTQRRIPLVTPYIHLLQGHSMLQRTKQLNHMIAQAIDAQHFELAFVKDCQTMSSPYLLRYIAIPSIFQCHHVQRPAFETQTAQSALSIQERLKWVYYAPTRTIFQHILMRDELHNICRASRVLTNSAYSQQVLAERYSVQSHIIYPGINTELFRPHAIAKGNFVLCVGSLNYLKGYRFLITALARIHTACRPALFIAANSKDADEEKLVRAMAAQLGVELIIKRILNDEELVQVYNQADVFVYAPLQEALGMAPLEAAACGVPSVAVGEGGVRETIRNGVTGLLTLRDADTFAQQLQFLLCNEKERTRMGQAGIEHVRQHWTWSHAVDRLEYELTAGGAT